MTLFRDVKDRLEGKIPRGTRRSSSWPRVRAEHLKVHPTCAACGGRTKLEVHHVLPFHRAPELELEPSNLITLCEAKRFGLNCHLAVGHLGLYASHNPEAREDAARWLRKLHERPE